MKGEPTYSGEVEINSDLIDPKGIELPTQVFENAADAIDLDSYNEEVVNGHTYFVVNMFAYSRKVSKIERLKGQFPEMLKNERDENKRSDSHGR